MRNSSRPDPSICRGTTFATLGLVSLGWLAEVHAGVVMNSQHNNPGAPDAKPGITTYSFQDGAMRVEVHGSDGSTRDVMLFRDQAMYQLDPGNKTFMRFDKTQMAAMGDKLAQARQQMAAQMQSMTPEQRAMMQQAMDRMGGGAMSAPAQAPVYTVRELGKADTVAGIRCAMWEVSENGQKRSEVCAATPASLPGGSEILQTMQQLSEMSRNMMNSLRQGMGSSRQDHGVPGFWSQLQKIGGVPILSRTFDSSGKLDSEVRVLDIKNQSLTPAQFDVPADYKDRTPKLLQAGGH